MSTAQPKVIATFDETQIPAEEIKAECAVLSKKAVNPLTAREVLPRLRDLVDHHPNLLETNLAYAQTMEMTRAKDGMLDLWMSVHKKFPENPKALKLLIRWLVRSHRAEDANNLLDEQLPEAGISNDIELRLFKAELLAELRDQKTCEAYYETMISDFESDIRPRVQLFRRLREWGQFDRAWELISPVIDHRSLPRATRDMALDMRRGLNVLDQLAPELRAENTPPAVVALKCAIELFQNRTVASGPANEVGPIALITGSLGAGGAERQMARTSAHLEQARQDNRLVAGRTIKGPIHVVVKSLSRENGHDFFLPMLSGYFVQYYEIDNMPSVPFSQIDIDNNIHRILQFLPKSVAYGIHRLVRYFKEEKTEIAYIWQDGAVLFAALAALIAGVPRIVLAMRGLPPVLRQHLNRIEYSEMYSSLIKVPGVDLMSNSLAGAYAYCEWLKISVNRFAIVPNGVDPLNLAPGKNDIERWEDFRQKTADADITIGGVFRFDVDKRPLLWIQFAQEFLKKHSKTRFVLVGGGPQFAETRKIALGLGIAKHILFVGRSTCVGYWLTKMDTLVLLSRFEGLPNVLLEAQVTGIPVVSTPAGGACEAYTPGATGLAVSAVEDVDLSEVSEHVYKAAHWRTNDPNLEGMIRDTARQKFSTQRMVERTVALLTRRIPAH